LGKHPVTISRRLSNKRRRKRGLPTLPRRQVLVHQPYANQLDDIPPKSIRYKKEVYALSTNVYLSGLELIPQKRNQKKFLKQFGRYTRSF
jgi:hypothetical protein